MHIIERFEAWHNGELETGASKDVNIGSLIYSTTNGVMFLYLGYIFAIAVPVLVMVEDTYPRLQSDDNSKLEAQDTSLKQLKDKAETIPSKTLTVLQARQRLDVMPGVLWAIAYFGASEILGHAMSLLIGTGFLAQICIRHIVSVTVIGLHYKWTCAIVLQPTDVKLRTDWKRVYQSLLLPTLMQALSVWSTKVYALVLDQVLWQTPRPAWRDAVAAGTPGALRLAAMGLCWIAVYTVMALPPQIWLLRQEVALLHPEEATVVEIRRLDAPVENDQTMYERYIAPYRWTSRTCPTVRIMARVMVVYAKVFVPLAFLFLGAVVAP